MPPEIYAHSSQFERALACQIILLAPMAPHFASELWSGFTSAANRINNSGEILWDKTVLEQKWPVLDSHYNLDLVCQVCIYLIFKFYLLFNNLMKILFFILLYLIGNIVLKNICLNLNYKLKGEHFWPSKLKTAFENTLI